MFSTFLRLCEGILLVFKKMRTQARLRYVCFLCADNTICSMFFVPSSEVDANCAVMSLPPLSILAQTAKILLSLPRQFETNSPNTKLYGRPRLFFGFFGFRCAYEAHSSYQLSLNLSGVFFGQVLALKSYHCYPTGRRKAPFPRGL